MITAILQMAVFLGCAFAFAAYLLHIDRKDKQDARQKKIEFPRPSPDEEHEHQGAAMSHL
jgi:hypothetical protein